MAIIGTATRRVPVGVVLLIILDCLLTGYISSLALDVVLNPDRNWLPATKVAAPLIVLAGGAVMAAGLGTYFGSRAARVILVGLIGFFCLIVVLDTTSLAMAAWPLVAEIGGVRNIPLRSWWEFSAGPRWMILLLINYWCLFRSHLATHF